MSKWIPGLKKAKKNAAPVPRSLEEITKEFGQFCTQAGSTRYQIFVYEKELERLNTLMANLNYEAEARKKLDAATPPPVPATEQQTQSGAV